MYSLLPIVIVLQATGQLKLTPGGLLWKKAGGGKSVELKKAGEQPFYARHEAICLYFILSLVLSLSAWANV